jgi:pyruvate formate lyase activating enzyme
VASLVSTSDYCNLVRQGYSQGACTVVAEGRECPACAVTLDENRGPARLTRSLHLSRPENYFSIYQSGCNLSCRKCHSWEFSQHAAGSWYTPPQILEQCVVYDSAVTLIEPREKATSFHAADTCRCCGGCLAGRRPPDCPGVLEPDQILLSPQGFGPARNIVGFTGGDLTCRPLFYCRCTQLIKANTRLWVLIETNGVGLTDANLNALSKSGVDSFWLDIKAFDNAAHEWLTGVPADRILGLPERILQHGFVLEVLSLYIPGVVEADQLKEIARRLVEVDPALPFTLLAFFPQYKMRACREPTFEEMKRAYLQCKETGLRSIRVGNAALFARTPEQRDFFAHEGAL